MPFEFRTEQYGYNRSQVDTVLQGLTEQYQSMYVQYNDLNALLSAQQEENAALRQGNGRLNEQLSAKQGELEQLSRRVQTLAATGYDVQTPQSSKPIPGEFMDLILRHSLEIISDAREEADRIVDGARDDRLHVLTRRGTYAEQPVERFVRQAHYGAARGA
ncbi:MAG: DivIVA domain-containing protein [Oscillospiraceae bacterium]|jgi:cell division septum initiation protein DivIVA|nr:DivIVA domain-containing protein [Oscillospiraceae bacterium]